MSLMFGKVKTCNSAAASDQSPADCNLVLLGVMGSGKSGPTFSFYSQMLVSCLSINALALFRS